MKNYYEIVVVEYRYSNLEMYNLSSTKTMEDAVTAIEEYSLGDAKEYSRSEIRNKVTKKQFDAIESLFCGIEEKYFEKGNCKLFLDKSSDEDVCYFYKIQKRSFYNPKKDKNGPEYGPCLLVYLE